MRLLIERFASDDEWGTLSRFRLEEDLEELVHGYMVELPWAQNVQGESCIPEGVYEAAPYSSPQFGRTVLLLEGVPNRTYIEVHVANAPHQLDGCFGPGESRGWAADYEEWADREEYAVWNSEAVLDRILDTISAHGVKRLEVEVMAMRYLTEDPG